MEIITGELLGDGHIRVQKKKDDTVERGRLEFTFGAVNLSYAKYLKFIALAEVCNKTELTPWPNLNLTT
jgi:hypothetical protein